MPELPASVRLALWATEALRSGSVGLEEAVRRATPDVTEVDGAEALARLDLWSQVGERAVFAALPAPGDVAGLPRGAELVGAALEAGECVWAPLVGGALVPEFEVVGPVDDQVDVVRWQAYDCSPPPPHTLYPTDPAEAGRSLRTALLEATTALETLDMPSWRTELRTLADERLDRGRRGAAARWGLPPEVDDDALTVLTEAATVGIITGTALESVSDATTARAGDERERILRALAAEARRSLAAATNSEASRLAQG